MSVFLALKYTSKSSEVTPSTGRQVQVQAGVKQKKKKHSSSTTGMGERPGVVKTGGEKKKGRRKRSSSSPKVGSQIKLQKGTKVSTKQDSTKETMQGK